jgi:hypothetical protein
MPKTKRVGTRTKSKRAAPSAADNGKSKRAAAVKAKPKRAKKAKSKLARGTR